MVVVWWKGGVLLALDTEAKQTTQAPGCQAAKQTPPQLLSHFLPDIAPHL